MLASFPLTTDFADMEDGNIFIFDNALTLGGPVFIGLEWNSTFNDTVALYSDKKGEGNGEGHAWEQHANGSFGPLTQDGSSNGYDVDLWISTYYTPAKIISVEGGENVIPEQYALNQNYPNPFNPSTKIKHSIANSDIVELKIYNMLG